jgi:hypothetical protein
MATECSGGGLGGTTHEGPETLRHAPVELDGAFAQYHNEVQDMQAKSDELVRKNKSLCNKNKGMCYLVEYPLEIPCSSLTRLAC